MKAKSDKRTRKGIKVTRHNQQIYLNSCLKVDHLRANNKLLKEDFWGDLGGDLNARVANFSDVEYWFEVLS